MNETPDQATRRRWVTLAEVVAIAGLLIAATSLWMSWNDRKQDKAEVSAEKAKAAKAQTTVRLHGTVNKAGTVIALADANQQVETIDVTFPVALGVPPRNGVVPPRVETEWFSAALLKATDGGADQQEGHLPVLITSHWADADAARLDTAIYDIVWKTEGRLLRGRALTISGLVLRERSAKPARLDALWKKP